ncbi:TRAP transporter substrate-binding protein [Pusillimonas sp. CC-YST705]|uniref:TRAP transporter substrate-binding protein n=1 Tax=Mesopusillimonas faecipullorum TaxID=2755040 RepID=A0ABS8CBA9_9BURK|nr:TRAP transporter substrate-binding protein [Mesopusillimonas faecipullorum]MCB5363315.1 TRAP transporter substrate-binding protein [Mesopusillimonas faecipullorum]
MIKYLMSGLLAGVCALAGMAHAKEVHELRLAHYLPPMHNMAANVLPGWADRLEKASDGRLKVTIYPAGQLLGVTEIFDGVRGGVADIGWSMPGATPGRFPVMSLMELPFIFTRAEDASRVVMEAYEKGHMDKEFQGVKVLYLHTHHAGILNTKSEVRNLDDLKGKRIRFPSPPVRSLLQALGADPVGVPAPQAYESLDRGVLDGVAFPFDAMQGLRLGELVKYHLDFPMYVLTFYLVMNQNKFDSLPADLQKIIMDHSGMNEALAVGRAWDESEDNSKVFVQKHGNEIVVLSPEQQQLWRERAQPVIATGIAEADKAGVPGREIYETAVKRAAELQRK